MKRSREEPPARRVEEEEEEDLDLGDEEDLDEAARDEEEDELMAEAQAAGLIGVRPEGGGVDSREALREAYRSFAQDLPWIERLEVVSADPLGVASAGDDLKLELALCVGASRGSRAGGPPCASPAGTAPPSPSPCLLPSPPPPLPLPPSPPRAATRSPWLPSLPRAQSWSAWACRTCAPPTTWQRCSRRTRT